MSEVDRLSNSGLYPALPIADKRGADKRGVDKRGVDKRGSKEESARQPRPQGELRAPEPLAKNGDTAASGHPRPPKTLIDEYA